MQLGRPRAYDLPCADESSWTPPRLEVYQRLNRQISELWDRLGGLPSPNASAHEGPGEFRRHDIHPFPGRMTPPSWVLVAGEMRSWISAAADVRPRTESFPEQIAELHCCFEQIHPFIDGNGRTGRLVLNLLLVRNGYPPVIIYKTQRARYLKADRAVHTGQPLQVHRAHHRWARPARPPRGPVDSGDLSGGTTHSCCPRCAPGDERPRRSVAFMPELGRRVREPTKATGASPQGHHSGRHSSRGIIHG